MTTLTPTMAIQPNPCDGRTIISFELTRQQYAAVTIHDNYGELVTVLMANERAFGRFALVWDGRNSAGQDMPSGVYLACLQTSALQETQKIVLTRRLDSLSG